MQNLIYVLLILVLVNGCSKNEELQEIKVNKHEVNEPGDKTENNSDKDNNTSANKQTSLQTISSPEVKNHIGDSLIVRGFIAHIFRTDKVAYLNFEKKFPKNLLTATIFPDNFNEFGDLSKYNKKNVEIAGKISMYKNKPQIILTKSDQIKIVE